MRHRILAWSILAQDVLALLYRIEERGEETKPSQSNLQDILLSGTGATWAVLSFYRLCGHVRSVDGVNRLTDFGKERARGLVRSHRLWEQYLVSQAGVPAERIHDEAERLEHFTDRELRERLDEETATPRIDPHGRPIPPEDVAMG